MAEIQIKIDDKVLRARLEALSDKIAGPRKLLINFHGYMMRQTARTFQALGHGGSFRGVRWKKFAPQYTRLTDGVVVPAWGGVPKIRITRRHPNTRVKPRIRPSGQPVTPQSLLMQDTGLLRQSAGQSRIFEDAGRTLRMSTRGLVYAPRQQALRPFLFFDVPRDERVFLDMAKRFIEDE